MKIEHIGGPNPGVSLHGGEVGHERRKGKRKNKLTALVQGGMVQK